MSMMISVGKFRGRAWILIVALLAALIGPVFLYRWAVSPTGLAGVSRNTAITAFFVSAAVAFLAFGALMLQGRRNLRRSATSQSMGRVTVLAGPLPVVVIALSFLHGLPEAIINGFAAGGLFATFLALMLVIIAPPRPEARLRRLR